MIISGFPGSSVVKPAMQEVRVQSLGQEYPLEKEMATHSSILAWRISWAEELHSPWGCKKSDVTEQLTHSSYVSERFAICLSNNHLLLDLCKQLGMRNVLACLITRGTQKELSKDKTHPSNFKHTNPAISLEMSCTENQPALTALPLSCIFSLFFLASLSSPITHSSVLAWRIPGTGEPGGLPSMGSHRVGHD